MLNQIVCFKLQMSNSSYKWTIYITRVAEQVTAWCTNSEVPGSNPGAGIFFFLPQRKNTAVLSSKTIRFI